MDADTGKKGMRATISLFQNLAHNNLEMARIEGNVAIEPGTSNEGETGVDQQGKAIHRPSDTFLGSPPLRNAWYDGSCTGGIWHFEPTRSKYW